MIVGAASALLSACGAPPPNTAMTVDGYRVPTHLYDVLVRSSERRLQRQGVAVSPSSSAGAAHIKAIEVAAIRKLVRDAALEELAKGRHIAITNGELDTAVGRIEKGVGGAAVVNRQLALDQLSRQDFRDLLRFTLLEQKLSRADPKGFPAALATALKDAKVTAYVAPCDSNHDYPQCVSGS
ncbi:MAG TPA: SurA N-terminal domain-containing protein [Candidatus Dormibacteraeota bacterium]